MIRVKMRARWHLAGVSTNVSSPRTPDASQRAFRPGFFSAHFFTFWRAINSDTINALIFSKHASGIFLLFSRNNVAKEFEILRKWTKKMSKIRLDETLLGKTRAVII